MAEHGAAARCNDPHLDDTSQFYSFVLGELAMIS